MKKEELRKKYINVRKNIKNREEKSIEIFKNLIAQEEFEKAKIIALYNSLNTEVDTKRIIKHSLENGKMVLLPRVIENDIKFYKISKNEKLEKSSFGVWEPEDDNTKKVLKSEIDLVIVPGICFDKDKNRIGFGKGYYDRFLDDYKGKTIAICYEKQVLKNEKIPFSKNDIKVEKIITEERVII